MSDIVCLKLQSGEELIGDLRGSDATTYTMRSVASIVVMPGQIQGQVGLGLMPFLPYSDNSDLPINASHVVVKFTPGVDMLNNYNRMFGSGIQIARTM